MKKILASGVITTAALMTACATPTPVGVLYTDVTLPAEATSNGVSTKVGVAKCQSILALLATGDCSVEAAKKAGGIQEVTHVDWKANNILGIIGNYEVVVHGK